MSIPLNHIDASALPDEVRDLIGALIEGRVATLMLIAEIKEPDGQSAWIQDVSINMDGNDSNMRAAVGTLEIVKDEVMSLTLFGDDDIEMPVGDPDDDDDDDGAEA